MTSFKLVLVVYGEFLMAPEATRAFVRTLFKHGGQRLYFTNMCRFTMEIVSKNKTKKLTNDCQVITSVS